MMVKSSTPGYVTFATQKYNVVTAHDYARPIDSHSL